MSAASTNKRYKTCFRILDLMRNISYSSASEIFWDTISEQIGSGYEQEDVGEGRHL